MTPKGKRPEALRQITRFEYKRRHGWWVRFQRSDGGLKVVTSKFFTDLRYGGKRKALEAAQAWRDKTAKKVRRAKTDGSQQQRTPAGYGYVKLRPQRNHRNGETRQFLAYVGFLKIAQGRHAMTKWSVTKWGDKKARRHCEGWLERKRQEFGLKTPKSARKRAA